MILNKFTAFRGRCSFLVTLAFMSLPAAAFSGDGEKRQAEKPNIVLITADDLGYECISANGCEDYKTPVIDKLAADGVRFTQCFANPLCTPSRVKLMTGLYNKRNYRKFGKLSRSETTFAHLLKKAGYATAVAGKWQLGSQSDSPQHFGFDQSCLWQHTRGADRKGSNADSRYPNPELDINGKPVDYKNGEYGPDVCSDFLCDFINDNKDKPFLVYYPMILPHAPVCPTPDSRDWYPKSMGRSGRLSDSEQKRLFKDMVEYIDKVVGKIITTLETNGLRENTLVIFTGDNGTMPIITNWNGRQVKGGKRYVTDEGARVPLVINWPGHIKPRVDERELVEFSDFLPTLCELAGVLLPEGYPGDGVSLMPVLTGNGKRSKPYIYMFHWNQAWARTVDYGVYHRSKGKKSGYTYQKFGGHYDVKEVKLDSEDESGRKTLERLRKVVDDFDKVGRKGS